LAANDQIEVSIDSTHFDQTFDAGQISRIQVYGQAGNDHITVDHGIVIPAMIFTGAGNNVVQTGDGNPVVDGGGGKIHINGGTGRDLLIGGGGKSTINGNNGESIIIAGTTTFGDDAEALLNIESEWASNDTLADRMSKITAGVGLDHMFALNGKTVPQTNPQTVFANGHHNHLNGGSRLDSFFPNLSKHPI